MTFASKIHRGVISLLVAGTVATILFASLEGLPSPVFGAVTAGAAFGLLCLRPVGIILYAVWIGLWILAYFHKSPQTFKALRDLSPASPGEWLHAFWMDFAGVVWMCVFLGYLLLPPIRQLFFQPQAAKRAVRFDVFLGVLVIATGLVLAVLRFAGGYSHVF